MKLLIKKLWFPHSIEETLDSLFSIPQLKERFKEGYAYTGEIRPRGIRICPGYWPANEILEKVSNPEKDVCLILTSMELRGDYGGIHGKGRNHVAIASSDSYTSFPSNSHPIFHPDDVDFNAMAFSEIGHALGLEHHEFEQSNPCQMSHNYIPGPRCSSLEEIRFCDKCFKKLK